MKQCNQCGAYVAKGYLICPKCGGKSWAGIPSRQPKAILSAQGVPHRSSKGMVGVKVALAKPFKQAALLPSWMVATVIFFVVIFFGLIYAGTDWVADEVAKSAPVKVEISLLEAVLQDDEVREMLNKALGDDHPYTRMTRLIGSDLLSARNNPAPYQYKFFVIPKDEINAFAAPGGLIVVYTGLIEVLDTPEQFGAVLAHEIAHVELRHTLRQHYRSIGTLALMNILFGVAQDSGTRISVNLLALKYSREHETEADLEGAQLLARAGVSPQAAVSMLEKLDEIESGWTPTILMGHPKTGVRAKRVAQLPELQRDLPEIKPEWRTF